MQTWWQWQGCHFDSSTQGHGNEPLVIKIKQ
jgi:hypothetical protein